MTDILPQDPNAAIKKMIALANDLIQLMQEEGRSIAMNDAIGFSVSEQSKSATATRYEQGAAEFLTRAGELRQFADKALFDELLARQTQLRELAGNNNAMLEKISGVKAANNS